MSPEKLTFEEKYNQCVLKARKFVEEIQQIDPEFRVIVMVESGEISSLESSGKPYDSAMIIGMLKVFQIRVEEQERIMFNRRREVTDIMNRLSDVKVEKEKLN